MSELFDYQFQVFLRFSSLFAILIVSILIVFGASLVKRVFRKSFFMSAIISVAMVLSLSVAAFELYYRGLNSYRVDIECTPDQMLELKNSGVYSTSIASLLRDDNQRVEKYIAVITTDSDFYDPNQGLLIGAYIDFENIGVLSQKGFIWRFSTNQSEVEKYLRAKLAVHLKILSLPFAHYYADTSTANAAFLEKQLQDLKAE